MMSKKVAVVLAGCGVFDGSEIHEAVITILNLHKVGAEISFFAPDVQQADVVNHLEGAPDNTSRRVLVESARIARGKVSPLSDFNADDFDAIVFPGGFGAAKNLCTFAFSGTECTVNADVQKAIDDMLSRKKPLGFLCIAPVVAAKAIGNGVRVTIGTDEATANAVNAMGAKHVNCSAVDFVEDENFKVFSTPAYMLASNTAEIDVGVSKMISAMLK